ncbi:MAG: phosphate acyltransferase, partial [Gemmatimonadota bacterium]|nr:phosphate acyltransferase [Gemmatimonadota bacterium]
WVRALAPDLIVDGEMQADTAVDGDTLAEEYSFNRLNGPANILVFPKLSAANAAYKLLDKLGGAEVIGPILLGMSKPVHLLQRGCTAQDVVHLVSVASVDAQTRKDHITESSVTGGNHRVDGRAASTDRLRIP